MKKALLIAILLFSPIALAQKVEVECFTADKVFYHKFVEQVYPGDTYIAAVSKNTTEFIVGDCIVTYANNDLKKQVKNN
jgi:membrane-bound acyltransferase YfiQ involved in biofilm formation